MRLQITILALGLVFDIFIASLIYKQKTSEFHTQSEVLAYQDTQISPTPFALSTHTPSPSPTSSPTPDPSLVLGKTEMSESAGQLEPSPDPTTTPQPTLQRTISPSKAPATKAPQPTATPDIAAPPHLEPVFDRYAAEYGVDKNLLKKVAKCESSFNAGAVNGPYAGMYQYSESRWIENRQIMGLDPNPELRFNADEAIKTAAFFMVRGGITMWPNCH